MTYNNGIVLPDGSMIYLNTEMIRKQGLNESEVDVLHKLHVDRFNVMQKFKQTFDIATLLTYVGELEKIEYRLQDAWHFNQDRNYHYWWCHVHHCSCDKHIQQLGQPRIVSPQCILHRGPRSLSIGKAKK